MKIAVIHQDDRILVEFPPEVFISMLKTKMKLDEAQSLKLDQTMEEIKTEIKQKVLST